VAGDDPKEARYAGTASKPRLRTVMPLQSHKDGFMVLCMKTTIDLPDDLLIQAKKRAAELRRPLRALIADGLRAQLTESKKGRRRAKKLRLVTAAGGLPPGLSLTDRAKMHEWLERES
jgi:hypothetical protein